MTLGDLQSRVADEFTLIYGSPPTHFISSPGRVNVIGEHVDYNGGQVLPAAINRWICAAVRPRTNGHISLSDARQGVSGSFRIDALARDPAGGWLNYAKGVIAGLAMRGVPISGFDLTFASTIPVGGGLSSSAALEATIALAAITLANVAIDRLELARICQQAEHDYANVPCGLMDQAAVLLSREDHLLLLDCETQKFSHCPWSDPTWSLMIVNSGVAHELASGEYRQRREACERAAKILGVSSLRHVEYERLSAALAHPALDENARKCVRHVVTEIRRTTETVEALRRSDYFRAGELLRESHASLRFDYRVSCDELDLIAETANAVDGVAGCRMTGGGFGGSAIALVRTDAIDRVRESVQGAFEKKFSRVPAIFSSRPVAGARAWAA